MSAGLLAPPYLPEPPRREHAGVTSGPLPPPGPPPSPAGSARPCAPLPRLSGEELAASWPSYLGRRVRVRGRIERAIDYVHVVVRAGTQPFVALLVPDKAWKGEREQVYFVMGSTTVSLPGGPVTVPDLVFDAEGERCREE